MPAYRGKRAFCLGLFKYASPFVSRAVFSSSHLKGWPLNFVLLWIDLNDQKLSHMAKMERMTHTCTPSTPLSSLTGLQSHFPRRLTDNNPLNQIRMVPILKRIRLCLEIYMVLFPLKILPIGLSLPLKAFREEPGPIADPLL
jgi:hypothetical protein